MKKAYLNVDGMVDMVNGKKYQFGTDDFVLEDGAVYTDTGNGNIIYKGHIDNIDEWDGEYDGEVEIYEVTNWKVRY